MTFPINIVLYTEQMHTRACSSANPRIINIYAAIIKLECNYGEK